MPNAMGRLNPIIDEQVEVFLLKLMLSESELARIYRITELARLPLPLV